MSCEERHLTMAESPFLEERRENWGSRAGFVLAAIGSAVGLGNLWGFPYKVYSNGGGAFLIPYAFAMVAIGIPLLILEFSLGHMTQRAAPDAYRGINRKTEPVGWWGILLGFVIITYYPVILAWCGNFLVFCIQGIFNGGKLPWMAEGGESSVDKVGEFFKYNFLNQWTKEELAGGAKEYALGSLAQPIVISLAAVWVAMYLCIFRGVKLVSKVVMWTVPLPWVMLLILTVRGLTLPGATQGLNFFLDPKWEMLLQPGTWRWAFGQMFFSMSLAFGVMITYASFLHRKSDINNNATIIGLADTATSFVAGIAVFATLGGMAYATQQAGNAVAVENVVEGGPDLAFKAFPYALAQLPAAPWFGAVFFIALITLGIDSAFSITESVLTSIVDKTGWHRGATLIGMSVVGFGLGLFYCSRGGMTWVGSIDDLINGPWGIALIGLLEAVLVGWAYRIGRLREHANERSDWRLGVWWDWLVRYLIPVVLSALVAWSVMDAVTGVGGLLYDEAGAVDPTKLVGLLVAVAAPILALVLSAIHSPGADTHAQHVGQERLGRLVGGAGTLLALAAVTILCLTVAMIVINGAPLTDESTWPAVKLSELTMPKLTLFPVIAAADALIAMVVGGFLVHRAEKTQRRPSGLARLSGGVGVLTLGAACGVMLFMLVAVNPVDKTNATEETPTATSQDVRAGVTITEAATEADATGEHATAEAAASEAAPQEAATATEEGMSTVSYIMLASMLTVLVAGLGWCFYRAIKASVSTGEGEEQKAEV